MPDVSLNGIEFKIKGSSDAASDSIDKLVGKLSELRTALKQASGAKSLANGLNSLRTALNDLNKANTGGIKKTFGEIAKAAKPLENISNVSKNMASFMRGLAKLSENPEGLADVTDWLAQIAAIDFSNLSEAGEAIRNITSATKAVASGGKANTGTDGTETVSHGLKDFFSTERMTNAESSNLAYGLDSLRIGLLGVASGALNATKGLLKLAITGMSGFSKMMTKAVTYPVRNAISSIKGFTEKIGGLVSGFKRIVMYRMIRAIIKDIAKAMEEGAEAAYFFSKRFGDKTKYISKMLDSLSASSKGLGSQMGAAWATLLAAITPIVNQIIAIFSKAVQVVTQFFALLGGSGVYLKAKNATSDWADETARGAGAAKEWKNQLMGFDELNRLNEPGGGGGGSGATDYGSMFEEVPVEQGVKDFFNSLKQEFEDGDWEHLGTLIGDKINQIVKDIHWGEIGAWIGEKINALFTTTYWTLNTINFQNIGTKIAEFLNNAIEKINFENLGGIIAEKLTIIPSMIVGAINELDLGAVGKSLGDTIKGFFSDLGEWADSINWAEFGTNLAGGLIDAFKGLDVSGIVKSLKDMLGKVVTGIATGLGAISAVLSEAVTTAIYNAFHNDDGTKKTGQEIINGIWEGIKTSIANVGNWITTNVLDPFVEGFKSAFGIASPAKEMEGPGQMVGEGILAGILKPFAAIGTWLTTNIINPIKDYFGKTDFTMPFSLNIPDGFVEKLKGIKDAWDSIKKKKAELTPKLKWSDKNQKTIDKLKNAWAKIVTQGATLTANLKNNVEMKVLDALKVAWDKIQSVKATFTASLSANNTVKNFIDAWNKLGTKTLEIKASLSDKIKSAWNGVAQAWNNNKILSALGKLPVLANGGIPQSGQLFIARERGPEIVGKFGNQTGVLNNNQIVESVSRGVARSLSGISVSVPSSAEGNDAYANEEVIYRAFRRALDETDFGKDINLDGNAIYKSVVSRNKKEIFRTGVNPMMSRA